MSARIFVVVVALTGAIGCACSARADPPAAGSLAPPSPIPPSTPRTLALGGGHGCAVRDGSVLCWGDNDAGQVGSGTATADPRGATPVRGLSGVVEVALGERHTCARLAGGTVSCWGSNASGQLGLPGSADDDHPQPTAVPWVRDVVQIAAGDEFTCARHSDGAVTCWGRNDYGQFGSGPGGSARQSTPVRSAGLRSVADLALGGFGCARIGGGRVHCWSGNESDRPADVPALAGAIRIAVGELSGCAVMGDGTVRCWGANESGQLGREASDDRDLRDVPGLRGVVEVVLGGRHGCARLRDGSVRCWGSEGTGAYPARCLRMTRNQSHGPHGGSAAQWRYCPEPTAVPGLAGVVEIAAGTNGSCATLRTGAVQCWGSALRTVVPAPGH